MCVALIDAQHRYFGLDWENPVQNILLLTFMWKMNLSCNKSKNMMVRLRTKNSFILQNEFFKKRAETVQCFQIDVWPSALLKTWDTKPPILEKVRQKENRQQYNQPILKLLSIQSLITPDAHITNSLQ